MLPQALEVTFDCLTDVPGRFHARSALGNTPRQSGTGGHKHPVLVWFQVHSIFHLPNILPYRTEHIIPGSDPPTEGKDFICAGAEVKRSVPTSEAQILENNWRRAALSCE